MDALTSRASRRITNDVDSSKPRTLLAAAWVATLLTTATYLALILQFELRWVVLGFFVALSIAVIAYWLPGERVWTADEVDSLMDPLNNSTP